MKKYFTDYYYYLKPLSGKVLSQQPSLKIPQNWFVQQSDFHININSLSTAQDRTNKCKLWNLYEWVCEIGQKIVVNSHFLSYSAVDTGCGQRSVNCIRKSLFYIDKQYFYINKK